MKRMPAITVNLLLLSSLCAPLFQVIVAGVFIAQHFMSLFLKYVHMFDCNPCSPCCAGSRALASLQLPVVISSVSPESDNVSYSLLRERSFICILRNTHMIKMA